MKKVVAITGASGKIGFALAKTLAIKKYHLLLGDTNAKKIKILKKNFSENIEYFPRDLTNTKNIEEFISFGIKKFKKIDSIVFCAYPKSKNWGAKFEDLKEEYLKEDLYNQLGSTIIFCQKIIKYFLKSNINGNIILISSIQGISSPKFEHYYGTKMTSPIEYSAIKSAIISITKYLSKYLRNKKIRINCISPGGIKNNQPKKFINAYKKSCNTKGLLDPIDIVNLILFLLSKNSEYINGQNLTIDDGWSL
jgi:NAD(P)-dependent dehydrogenase (short-subunit alcohol dehydrogenase family)